MRFVELQKIKMEKCFKRGKFFCYIHNDRIMNVFSENLEILYRYRKGKFEMIELTYDEIVLQNAYGEKYRLNRTINCWNGCRVSVKDIEEIFGKPGLYKK